MGSCLLTHEQIRSLIEGEELVAVSGVLVFVLGLLFIRGGGWMTFLGPLPFLVWLERFISDSQGPSKN